MLNANELGQEFEKKFLANREMLINERIETKKVGTIKHLLEYLNSEEFSNDNQRFLVFFDSIEYADELLRDVIDWKAKKLAFYDLRSIRNVELS